jgi:hypothetical protein
MAHRFVLMAREFHLEAEWEDVLVIVVKRFPLLGRSSQQSAASSQPNTKASPLMNTDDTDETDKNDPLAIATAEDDTPAWLRARGLRKVASGALALHMLIAMASGQAAPSHWQLPANQNSSQHSPLSTQSPQQAQRRCLPGAPIQRSTRTLPLTNTVNTIETAVMEAEAGADDTPGPRSGGRALEMAHKEPVVYGAPLNLAAMAHAPTNEGGVLFLFGVLAERLGFRIERVQTSFPDCEAKREVRPGVWKHSKVELEFESRNFKDHRHDPKGCDVIVCWVHNWPECPRGIEVIELSRIVGDIDA